jgi:hypothetical protein
MQALGYDIHTSIRKTTKLFYVVIFLYICNMKFRIIGETQDTEGCGGFMIGCLRFTAMIESRVDRVMYEQIIHNKFDKYIMADDVYTSGFVSVVKDTFFGYLDLYSLMSGGKTFYRRADTPHPWLHLQHPERIKTMINSVGAVYIADYPHAQPPNGYVECSELDAAICFMLMSVDNRYDHQQEMDMIAAVLAADRLDKIDFLDRLDTLDAL